MCFYNPMEIQQSAKVELHWMIHVSFATALLAPDFPGFSTVVTQCILFAVPGATLPPALVTALKSEVTVAGNYTTNNTTLYVVTVGNTSFATNCTAANITTSLKNPLNTTLLSSLNCTAINATNSTNLTQAFPLLRTAPPPAQVSKPSGGGKSSCCKIPVVNYFCGWFGSGCSWLLDNFGVERHCKHLSAHGHIRMQVV